MRILVRKIYIDFGFYYNNTHYDKGFYYRNDQVAIYKSIETALSIQCIYCKYIFIDELFNVIICTNKKCDIQLEYREI